MADTPPKYTSPDDVLKFFTLLQSVMATCPDTKAVNALHQAALSSRLRHSYVEGAWESFNKRNAPRP
jgi:hypothetical protein